MAEIFGAVASGAGLVSLSMQLLESAQKLKGFYNSSRDAPETVRQLCFDLETMSMALRQFEQYRQNDVFGSELLDRCIMACDQAVGKIKVSVDKVDRLLSKARFAGRIYMGFKEPEVKKLLEDMEHAKSSMLLAYTSYCQHWNMREAARHASVLTFQNQQLERLQASVDSGKLALIDHIAGFASQVAVNTPSPQSSTSVDARANRVATKLVRRGRTHKFRLSLPRWLVGCVWEFAFHECGNVWTFQLSPINLRPWHTYVFDFVRAGDVRAVRELIRSRQLSVQDRVLEEDGCNTLLETAAQWGNLELCRYILQETAHPDEDAVLRSAFDALLGYATGDVMSRKPGLCHRPLLDAVYDLFVGDCALEININNITRKASRCEREKFMFLTDAAFEVVLACQPVHFAKLPYAQIFNTAIESVGWPAEAFSALLKTDPNDLALRTNDYGQSALHWAASHFGEWSRRSNCGSSLADGGFNPIARAKSYGRLASELVNVGADVHALYRDPNIWSPRRLDPFLAFLAGVGTDVTWLWTLKSLHDAVSSWGEMLVDGGQDLADYIATENRFLKSVKWDKVDRRLFLWTADSMFVPMRLLASDESKLILKIKRIFRVPLWKAKVNSMPGAWPISCYLPLTIPWVPGDTDRQSGYRWVESRSVKIQSTPYRTPEKLDYDKNDNDHDVYFQAHATVQYELTRAQDDCSLVAQIVARVSRARQMKRNDSRHRASSGPPTPSHFTTHYGGPWCNKPISIVTTPAGWKLGFHKCMLDSRWRMRLAHNYLDDPHFWRKCMQGRCQDQIGPFDNENDLNFERWFLSNEDYIHVAKRYAEKFYPDHMHIVEAILERKHERIRLAMGPKRREDSLKI